MVVSELRGEKIDIIPFNDEPARFVAKALSPARVREVLVDDDAKQATVIVPDDQLSLAIGREGQNARLAARLTGWRVDIRSETEFAAEEAEHGYEEEEVHGRCAAILSNGRRCPNAALPGSRYCGLETHQALAAIDSDKIVDLQAKEAPAEAPAEPAVAVAAPGEETAQAAQSAAEAAADSAPTEESAPAEVAQPEAETPEQSAAGADEGDAPAQQPPAEAQASDSGQPAAAEQPAGPDEGSLEQPAPDDGSLEQPAPVAGQQQASAQGSPAAGEEQAQ
jgi:N utilization substance protein A